jgi:hypothetical protein
MWISERDSESDAPYDTVVRQVRGVCALGGDDPAPWAPFGGSQHLMRSAL